MSGNPMSYAKEKVDSNIVELGLTDESGNPIKVVNRTQHMDLFIEAAQSKTKPRSHLVRKHEMVVLKLNVTNNKSAISVWAIPEETATKTMILCRKSRQPSLEKFDFRQVVPKEPGNSSDSLEPSPPESQRYQLFIGTDDMNGTVIGTWYCGFYYNGSAHEDDEENAPEKINLTITIFESTCKYFDNDAHEWRYDGCKVMKHSSNLKSGLNFTFQLISSYPSFFNVLYSDRAGIERYTVTNAHRFFILMTKI